MSRVNVQETWLLASLPVGGTEHNSDATEVLHYLGEEWSRILTDSGSLDVEQCGFRRPLDHHEQGKSVARDMLFRGERVRVSCPAPHCHRA
jgi:hypothetical protein